MKPSAYLLAIVFLVSFTSCAKKKDTPYNPSGALAAVVKTVTHSNTGTTDTYTYNGSAQIQLIQNSSGNKTAFEYNGNAITQTVYDITGGVVSISHLVTDTFGLVISSVVNDAVGAVLANHTYTYDTDKHKTFDNIYTANNDVNGKLELIWGGGNLFEYAVYDSAISHKQYNAYNWYYDPAVTSFGNNNTGQKFWGADSKFLLRRVVGNIWGGGNTIATYEYTFDAQQKITEAKTFDFAGNLKNTDSYTYY